MYYFEVLEDKVNKYEVSFDRDIMEELRIEIINNCSEIVHHNYIENYDHRLDETDYLRIRRYSRIYVGIDEKSNSSMYRYIYDEYKFPKLVFLIDKLLNGDTSVIGEIFSPSLDKDNNLSYTDRIGILIKEIGSINNEHDKKKTKVRELMRLISLAKINKGKRSDREYYSRVRELIQINLVDSISLNEVYRLNNFFKDNDKVLNRVLKKDNK